MFITKKRNQNYDLLVLFEFIGTHNTFEVMNVCTCNQRNNF